MTGWGKEKPRAWPGRMQLPAQGTIQIRIAAYSWIGSLWVMNPRSAWNKRCSSTREPEAGGPIELNMHAHAPLTRQSHRLGSTGRGKPLNNRPPVSVPGLQQQADALGDYRMPICRREQQRTFKKTSEHPSLKLLTRLESPTLSTYLLCRSRGRSAAAAVSDGRQLLITTPHYVRGNPPDH